MFQLLLCFVIFSFSLYVSCWVDVMMSTILMNDVTHICPIVLCLPCLKPLSDDALWMPRGMSLNAPIHITTSVMNQRRCVGDDLMPCIRW